MNRKKQGDIGVAVAIAYYTLNGYSVSTPLSDSQRYDLITDKDNKLKRIQVKTTSQVNTSNIYTVELSTQGGNQSWGYSIKYITQDEADEIFVYCLNGEIYVLPIDLVVGVRRLRLSENYNLYKAVLDIGEFKRL